MADIIEPEATPTEMTLWYTRCPLPTASSMAIDYSFLDDAFASDGVAVRSLRASMRRGVRESHFDHSQSNSFREGGNIPPMWTRAQGGTTRLIATGWVDEYQAVIAMPQSGIRRAADLKGRRLALPRRVNDQIDYWRAMCRRGYEAALAAAGLSLADVELIDLPVTERYIPVDQTSRTGTLWHGEHRARRQQAELFAIIRGEVDAIYTAGAPGAELTALLGAVEVIELGRHPDSSLRVNNQVPILLTVSTGLLDMRPELVDRYLGALMCAAAFAADHPSETIRTIANDVGACEEWVRAAYGDDFHLKLRPSISEDRIAALEAQKSFLIEAGLLEYDFDLRAWIDPGPLTRLGFA